MPPIIDAERVSGLLNRLRGMNPQSQGPNPYGYVDDDEREADMLAPSVEDPEVYAAQEQYGGSRQQVRDSMMNRLRMTLRQQRTQHERAMQEKEAAARVTGEYDLRREQIAGQSRERQQQIAGDSRIAQAEAAAQAKQDALDRMLASIGGGNRSMSVSGVGSVGAERVPSAGPGSRAGTPTDSMIKRGADARSGYNGPMSGLARRFGMDGGRTEYEAALGDILDRKGKLPQLQTIVKAAQQAGDRAATVIADIESTGQALDPHEKEYLMLLLGQ